MPAAERPSAVHFIQPHQSPVNEPLQPRRFVKIASKRPPPHTPSTLAASARVKESQPTYASSHLLSCSSSVSSPPPRANETGQIVCLPDRLLGIRSRGLGSPPEGSTALPSAATLTRARLGNDQRRSQTFRFVAPFAYCGAPVIQTAFPRTPHAARSHARTLSHSPTPPRPRRRHGHHDPASQASPNPTTGAVRFAAPPRRQGQQRSSRFSPAPMSSAASTGSTWKPVPTSSRRAPFNSTAVSQADYNPGRDRSMS